MLVAGERANGVAGAVNSKPDKVVVERALGGLEQTSEPVPWLERRAAAQRRQMGRCQLKGRQGLARAWDLKKKKAQKSGLCMKSTNF